MNTVQVIKFDVATQLVDLIELPKARKPAKMLWLHRL